MLSDVISGFPGRYQIPRIFRPANCDCAVNTFIASESSGFEHYFGFLHIFERSSRNFPANDRRREGWHCLSDWLHSLCTSSTLFLPNVINVKIPLQPHQKYYITQFEELGFPWLTQVNDCTTNSLYLTYTFLFGKVGRIYFLNLGVKGWKHDSKRRRRLFRIFEPSSRNVPATYRRQGDCLTDA